MPATPNNAGELVTNKFSSAQSFAQDAYTLIQSYVNQIMSIGTAALEAPEITVIGGSETTPISLAVPTLPSNYPTAPTINDNFVFPDPVAKPDISMPTRPTTKDYDIPIFSSDVDVPQFTDTLPAIDLDPIEEADVMTLIGLLTDNYRPQLSEVKELLLERIREGGTGLPADVEDDIFNRNLERDEQVLQDAMDSVSEEWAKMGFTLPDGMLANQIAAIQQEYLNARLTTSRDISIKQAELEQTNINKAFELCVSIEASYNNALVGFANAAANGMRVAGEVSVQLYNSYVNYYNLLIESYKAKSDVYKTMMQAKLVDAEVYKAQVAGISAAIGAEESKVKMYATEVSAETEKLKAYEMELRGVMAQIETIKAWLDVGKTRMEVFSVECKSINDKYSAEIEGYKAQVQAWSAEADRQTKDKDISLREQIAEIDGLLKAADINIKNYEWAVNIQVEKMKTLSNIGAHIVAGALAAAHAQASVSDGVSQSTTYEGA